MAQKPSKVKKWFLAIGIAIIFVMFVNYATSATFNQPKYEDFCTVRDQKIINQTNQQECIDNGGQWTTYGQYDPKPVTGPNGYCDQDFTCRTQYEDAQKTYDSRAFIVKVIAGFIGLVLGLVLTVESVSAGFLLGGVLNLFFATVQYWDRFNDFIRVVVLAVALAMLVWIGYKKTK
ncbi:MAG TPA: hypothetical protein VKE88_02055 [Candidatus Nanoarchaeia archaeon]|nr:hypothetical protein [Candidatus Nanoarchaeia archaeon]